MVLLLKPLLSNSFKRDAHVLPSSTVMCEFSAEDNKPAAINTHVFNKLLIYLTAL